MVLFFFLTYRYIPFISFKHQIIPLSWNWLIVVVMLSKIALYGLSTPIIAKSLHQVRC